MIVSLWLGLREFGQDFDFAAPPHDTTVQTLAPNESLLRRLWLQTNLYCADKLQTNHCYSGSKHHYCAALLQTHYWQTQAPNESLLQTLAPNNLYCADSASKLISTADSASKLISTAQTLPPN